MDRKRKDDRCTSISTATVDADQAQVMSSLATAANKTSVLSRDAHADVVFGTTGRKRPRVSSSVDERVSHPPDASVRREVP